MKTILTAATALVALSIPVTAPAADVTMGAPSKPAAQAKSTVLLSKPIAKDDLRSAVPANLTIQQENDARQRAFEEMYHIVHMP